MDLLTWSKFNCYTFFEKTHQYFYYDKPVKTSVTQFVSTFFDEFDSEGVSKRYAEKHGMSQEDVLLEWERKGKISSTTGTMIHKYLEDYARGKVFEPDFSQAREFGIFEEVRERYELLLPQAKAFRDDTFNKLIPIQMEYTVGIEDVIAGNIDLLCWNVKAGEFQIWDYKNLKEMKTRNNFGKTAKFEFEGQEDCNLVHYSMQQNFYKVMAQRKLGIKIGKCYLVMFSHLADNFQIYQCYDYESRCSDALDRLVEESKR